MGRDPVHAVEGIITAVQEGRFQLVTDEGRVLQLMLAHNAAAEPQDLPPLQASGARIRVDYRDSSNSSNSSGSSRRLIAGVVERLAAEGSDT